MIPSSSSSNALGTGTPLPVSSNHLYTSNSGKSFEEIMAEQMSTQQIELDRLENTKDEKLKSTLPEETRNRIGVLPPPKNPQQLPVACGRPKIDYSKLGVDDFQKLKLIGKGDVGRVYLVLLKGTDLYFAMKILNKEEMISRNKVKRVLTEREILATVDHPFITTLFCSFQTKENLYFILEYCAGGEFFKVLKKQPNKCLPEPTVRFYAAEVVLALEYLHMKGFLYRDLKPENLLLHHSGHIRLTDFDLSKQSVQQVTPTLVKSFFSSQKQSIVELKQIQEFDSFIGTEEYLSPEILSGKKHNSCVDFWTLGILLYEMLFGFTPFKGSTQRETFFNILNNPVTFPSKTAYPVSKQAKDLMTQLLITDKDKRLGAQHGISDIKTHAFFKDISWALIRNEVPPIIPKLQSKLDTSYFNQYKMPEDQDEEEEKTGQENEEEAADNPFKNFKFQTKKDIEIFNGGTTNNSK
ncbi:Serine/threonine protein kinase [Naegleria gruberi]|uniref:non-specific serine/threonine protein kinase n=1 Tax=Naegleria gruberi TaxID=5762 RepID=D2VM97_NAEGR|nr:Serine/threonine protein kinase [Naegleria gruberi]EFC42025.1 Serine/threonine protein kinase [Naegleria gruberi]|eukprot:XP_002674769.1 Serine/threonine protein kinase [Naegleria gruberi strain NEG-M]